MGLHALSAHVLWWPPPTTYYYLNSIVIAGVQPPPTRRVARVVSKTSPKIPIDDEWSSFVKIVRLVNWWQSSSITPSPAPLISWFCCNGIRKFDSTHDQKPQSLPRPLCRNTLHKGRYHHFGDTFLRKRNPPCSPTTPDVKSTRCSWSGEGRNCSLNPSGSGEAGADEGCVIDETGVYWVKNFPPLHYYYFCLLFFLFFLCAVTCVSFDSFFFFFFFFSFKNALPTTRHGLHESTTLRIDDMYDYADHTFESISSSDWSDGIIHLRRGLWCGNVQ